MTSSVRLHQILLGAVLLVPALLFVGAAWQNYEDVLREGRDVVSRTAAVMQEHADKVFETAELAIGQVDERIDDMTWDRISEPVTSDFMRRLKSPMDQLVSLWVADAEGSMRAGSQEWPEGSGIANRSFFQVQRQGDRGTYIGETFRGLATSAASFAIVRRRSTADGRFDGTIHAAASPDYFMRFYAAISPPFEHVALLVRNDGAILAREPPDAERARLPGNSPLMQMLLSGTVPPEVQSEIATNGQPLEFSMRRVGSYPVYVVFAVPHEVMLARWRRNISVYGAVAACAALTLLVVSWLALRRAQAEQAALLQLQSESVQRQAAEHQLRHAQRMDAVGQLTGGVAHDFNNLLTAIMGNLELIQRAVQGPDGVQKVVRLTGTAMKAVQRGSALTKSLLAFSRKQPLQARAVDANLRLEDFMDLVRQAMGAGITATFTPQPGLVACIADPAELEAAILNLAINARDAMPDGGWLRLRTMEAPLNRQALGGNTEARPGRFVAIEVADCGVGMSQQVMNKAFEPFFTTKPIGQGTGLGLSQVFGFVRQLGGHVTIASVLGEGTVVTLYLPTAPD